jgi:glutamyl-tRNA reductase
VSTHSNYFPAFLDLRGRKAIVIGGGEVALRKVESLLAAGARVTVVAPQIHRGIALLEEREEVEVCRREYRRGDLEGAMIVVAASSEIEVNREVWEEASERNQLINVVDVPDLCNFIVPSVIKRDELTLAISTGGLSPALAKRMRQKLEEVLVPEYGPFLSLLGTLRAKVRQELSLPVQREAFWGEVVNSDAFDLFRRRGEAACLQRIEEILKRVRDGEPSVIVAVGLNHKVAPVEIRERFAMDGAELELVLDALGDFARERVVLSTCNRTEIYAVPERPKKAAKEIKKFLHQRHCPEVSEATISRYFYVLRNEDAAKQLFGVASGIDSMILGEPQILGQVRDAFELAAAKGTVGPILSSMFQRALAVGKRARTETAISRNAASVSHAAVELARGIFGEIERLTVLVVGAGEMGELTAKNLVDNGAGKIVVINRTWERAQELAERFGGKAVAWEALGDMLGKVDIVITSTGSPEPVFDTALVEPAIKKKEGRPLVFIDIAVPRDVDVSVGAIPNVSLYDIDDLQSVVERNLRERENEVAKVKSIIDEELSYFVSWMRCQDVVPTIVALRKRLDKIRRTEIAKHGGRLDLNDRDRNALEAMTQAMVNKILHTPTVRLKSQATDGACGLYIDALKELFDLD